MNLPIKKIISASAGTGKTYRLSLEYLALLLKHYNVPGFMPDQILVITFTRKATAEIRDRIYRHLDAIGNRKQGWQELALHLQMLASGNSSVNKDNPLSENETNVLRSAYQYLITHKDELQVMTIDSYVHSIFRNLVRPVRGIDRFELDLKAVEKRMPFLFNDLMTPALMNKMQRLLSRKLKPSLDEYKQFFRSLIDNRWLFYLAQVKAVNAAPNTLTYEYLHEELWSAKATEYYNSFSTVFKEIITNLSDFLQVEKNRTYSSDIRQERLLNADYVELFSPLPPVFGDLAEELDGYLKDEFKLMKLLRLLTIDKYLWNGQKIRASKSNPYIDDWKALHKQALSYLANYLIYRLFLPEQKEILDIWQDVLTHYDKLIYRYKNLTYDDIAWFTFEALYSSEPPLFSAEAESLANEFYEFMCHRTRFILIDEFQDTSILQFHILAPMIDELLAGEGSKPYGGLIVVGDEKQSIFGWRGGQRDLLLNLDNIFQSEQPAERGALTNSWRSSPTFMRFINNIFGHPYLQGYLESINAQWDYQQIDGMKAELEPDTIIQFQLGNYSSHSKDNKLDVAMREFVQNMVLPVVLKEDKAQRSIAILARRNDELEKIRALLAENNVASEFQSSKSLLHHQYVRAMLFILKFSVYGDWYDFLAFLRSDLVLMEGAVLKKVINIISKFEKDKDTNKQDIDFGDIALASEAMELAKAIDANAIYQSCLIVLETCRIQFKLLLPRDYVSVQKFLDVALDYEQNFQTELPELQGFLRYCEDNRDQEVMQQQDIESSTAVQLLTIHKSKGLEFDTVFVWWNLKSNAGREDSSLSSWVHYSDSSYQSLSDIALTLHYNKVLENSSYMQIMLADDKRAQLEELNNLYVALTRAKNRLYLYAAFEKMDGWDKYWDDLSKDDRLYPQHYAIKSALEYMSAQAQCISEGLWQIGKEQQSSTLADKDENSLKSTEHNEVPELKSILPNWKTPVDKLVTKDDFNPSLNWKQSYLQDRDNLLGNIAHFYLAQLVYADESELEIAKMVTLRQFGNLMLKNDLQALLDRIDAQLPKLKDLFSIEYDLVYTEYPVYSKGKEQRIDRLMINTKANTYRIIDYKTGDTRTDKQLDDYTQITGKLLPDTYKQETEPEFIEIKIK